MPYPIFSNSRAGDAVKIINSFFPKDTVKIGNNTVGQWRNDGSYLQN